MCMQQRNGKQWVMSELQTGNGQRVTCNVQWTINYTYVSVCIYTHIHMSVHICAWQRNFNFGCRYSATARRRASFANATPSAAKSMQHSKVHLQLLLLAACNTLWIIAIQYRTTIHPICNGRTHTDTAT